jgi:hypothetical protein
MKPQLRPTALKLAAAELLQEMARRGMTTAQLAGLIGYDSRSLGRHIGAGVPNWALRWRLEKALDWAPLWSPDNELQGRRQCLQAFGSDPRLLRLEGLKSLCRKLGVSSPDLRQREAWFQALMGWLAAHPQIGKHTEQTELTEQTKSI